MSVAGWRPQRLMIRFRFMTTSPESVTKSKTDSMTNLMTNGIHAEYVTRRGAVFGIGVRDLAAGMSSLPPVP
ncbi:hypothetical protein RN01_21615 [Cupriavidus sp. SHE]|nr:hypothetical protein RN01_21615 [Cupriavidus sp. SHE]